MNYRIDAGDSAVVVADGRIARPGTRADVVIAGDGSLLPGLINAHDHLHRNHYPRLGRPPYPDAYAWGRDIHLHDAGTIARARALPRNDALLFGAFRNLIGGVTTVVHHDDWESTFDNDFPIGVARVRTAHSIGFDRARAALLAGTRDGGPFTIHVAEGATEQAAAEIDELERLGLLRPGLLAVHAVALDAAAAASLHAAGGAIVWCPTSNLFLFGATCSREALASADVLLGTDALLTGEGTMLDELRAARALDVLPDERLVNAVTTNAAARLGVEGASLRTGAPADLLVLRAPLFHADVRDVALVTVRGVPRVADEEFAELFDLMGVPAEPMEIGGVRKLVLRPLAEAADRVMSQWPAAARIVERRAATPTAGAG